jgi:hypothetical protein
MAVVTALGPTDPVGVTMGAGGGGIGERGAAEAVVAAVGEVGLG